MHPTLRILCYSSSDSSCDLALEEALQLGLEEGSSPPTWRLWQAASPAIVLGTGQEHALEVNLPAARAAGVPILRRHSGGGAVLIGPGVINYSGFFRIAELPGAETITGAMKAALQPILKTLERLASNSSIFQLAGLSDIALKLPPPQPPSLESRKGVAQLGIEAPSLETMEGDFTATKLPPPSLREGGWGGGSQGNMGNTGYVLKKLAGHAQARKRVSVLVHGTLLADPDWELLERLLPFPSHPPEYRGGRTHREFLASLRELGLPFDLQTFAAALRTELGAGFDGESAPTLLEETNARRLLEEKYAKDEWNLRR